MARTTEYKALNMRVTPLARQLFAEIADNMGLSQTAAFETLVREKARMDGLWPKNTQMETNPGFVEAIAEPQLFDWSTVKNPSPEEYREIWKRIEAMGPIGPSISDEALTSEAMYADHA
jgi:hypothetical protein